MENILNIDKFITKKALFLVHKNFTIRFNYSAKYEFSEM